MIALWATDVTDLAVPVLDAETGQILEYRQFRRNPKYKKIWEQSYCNELGRLCQGISTGSMGPKKHCVAGTETFQAELYENIPHDRCSQIKYSKVVCEVRPQKADPNRTRITIGGSRIIYPGDVATPTGSLELVKLIINSVLSRHDATCAFFDISNFYLATPMDRSEYVKIKFDDVPQEFIQEYGLFPMVHQGWVYFKIVRGCYGLP